MGKILSSFWSSSLSVLPTRFISFLNFKKKYNDKVGDTDNDYQLTFSPESDGKWNTSTDKNEIPTQGIMTLTV